MIRHVAQFGFDRDLVNRGIESKQTHFARGRFQQIEQALDGGGFTGAIASEETLATTSLHLEIQTVDGIGPAVLPDQVFNLNNGFAHNFERLKLIGMENG